MVGNNKEVGGGDSNVRQRKMVVSPLSSSSLSAPGGGGGDGEKQQGIGKRVTANQFQPELSLHERILHDVFNVYADKENGLIRLGEMVGIGFSYPRKKVTVVVIGNHSAGKSSFINWYIEETVLRTGVAIETQGFSFVTSGKKRDTLKGQATVQLYPHLKPLVEIPGVMEYMQTEISPSRSRKFNLVTFVDTPGLVDGGMEYPFDVNEALLWLGNTADLVLVFFDPMGQALCKRTLTNLEALWANHSEKIRLYLAKADEAGSETDRQKVLMQIVQELCKRPGLNRSGFDMPTIFLPDVNRPTRCANQIDDVCQEIEKVINAAVQNSLNTLENDCNQLKEKLVSTLSLDTEARKRNFKRKMQGSFFGVVGFVLPLILFATLVVSKSTVVSVGRHIGLTAAEIVLFILNPLVVVWNAIPGEYHLQLVIAFVCFSAVCLILSRFFALEKVISNRDLLQLRQALEIAERDLERKHQLYDQYLRESLSDADYAGAISP